MTTETNETEQAPAAPPWEYSVLAGTPLGEALRAHWIPVLPVDVLSRQPARRVRLLGEDLVCYRDRSGTYGLIGDTCPHRGVSLEWGNAADVGLRCPYHGWCFDEAGHCVDIPLEGLITRDYVKITAHPVIERGGLLWAYLGEGEPPPPGSVEELFGEPVLRHLRFTIADRNWLLDLEQAAAPSGETWQAVPPFSLVSGTPQSGDEAIMMPIDDETTLLISAVRLGALPDGSGVHAAASDLAPNRPRVSGDDSGSPAGEVEIGPFARSWVAAILDPLAPGPESKAGASSGDGRSSLLGTATGPDEQAGPLADLSRAALSSADPAAIVDALQGADATGALDLLTRLHLPVWLDGAGAPEAAELLRSLPGGGVDATSTGEALRVAGERFESAVAETLRDPWAAAWPYAWNAETSRRWALGRDRAKAAAWRDTWQRASQALRDAGTVALYVTARATHPELATAAFRACELAVHASCWPSAWGNAWADAVSEVREADREAPEVEAVDGLLNSSSETLLGETLSALGATTR